MVQEFLVWWGEQLASLIPDTLRRSLSGADQTIVLRYQEAVAPGAAMIEAWLRSRGSSGLLGRFRLDEDGLAGLRAAVDRLRPGTAVLLQLPDGMLLEKQVQVPLAAQRDLLQVMRYELDRETPFSADEVYWAVAILGKDRTLGQMTACLTLAVKADVDPVLDALQGAGIKLAAMIDRPGGRWVPLGVKAGMREVLVDPTKLGRGPLLSGLIAVLALVAVVSPFVRQDIAFARVDARIAALQGDADTALALRRQNGGVGTDLGDPQTAVGNPLLVLAAVTDALPDDTFLSDFTQHHREIGMIGQSRDAAALIQRLSDNVVVRDPAFSAPVTRDPGAGIDNFAIKLSVRQP